MTDAERFAYLGEPTHCIACGSPLKHRLIERRGKPLLVRIYCPTGRVDDGHEWFEFDAETMEE